MLILLIRKEAIYNRILQHFDRTHIAPFLSDLASFQMWLADNSRPTAALLDSQWNGVEEAAQLLSRLGVSVTYFTGVFSEAEAWVGQNLVPFQEALATLSEKPEEVADEQTETSDESPTQEAENEEESALEEHSKQTSPVIRNVLHDNPLLKKTRPVSLSRDLSQQPVIKETGPSVETVKPDKGITEKTDEKSHEPIIIERIREVEKPVYIHEEVHTAIRSTLILVTGLWPRSGVSTIAEALALSFANRLPSNSVSYVEHPLQWPRMWGRFKADERKNAKRYRHWLVDGIGQGINVDGINLMPLPPEQTEWSKAYQEERLIEYVYRQMRKPITILDCGMNMDEELLFSMADCIVCVMDCDPTFLSIQSLGEKYNKLMTQYGEQVVTVLNKWTRFTRFADPETGKKLFEKAVKVPYLEPEIVQHALWEGSLLPYEKVSEEFTALSNRIVNPLIPKSLEIKQHKERWKIPFLTRGREED